MLTSCLGTAFPVIHSYMAGGGCIGLRVEPEGQRAGVLGAGAGQCPRAGVRGRDSIPERAPPKEPGDGQRVSIALAGEERNSMQR